MAKCGVIRKYAMTITVQKIEEEGPIPTEWRATLSGLVASIVAGDYKSGKVPSGVVPLEDSTIKQISDYINEYGCTIINLPEESWETSVYLWQGSYWGLLVDLYTKEEGRSDLVLSLKVTEASGSYSFEVYLIYVP